MRSERHENLLEGRLKSVHRLRLGYKVLLLSVCVLLGLLAIPATSILTDNPGAAPGHRNDWLIFSAVSFILLISPFVYSLVHLCLVWNQKVEIYERGLRMYKGRRSWFVTWKDIKSVNIDRRTTTFKYFFIPIGESKDMKAKIEASNRMKFKFHSGFDKVEEVLAVVERLAK